MNMEPPLKRSKLNGPTEDVSTGGFSGWGNDLNFDPSDLPDELNNELDSLLASVTGSTSTNQATGGLSNGAVISTSSGGAAGQLDAVSASHHHLSQLLSVSSSLDDLNTMGQNQNMLPANISLTSLGPSSQLSATTNTVSHPSRVNFPGGVTVGGVPRLRPANLIRTSLGGVGTLSAGIDPILQPLNTVGSTGQMMGVQQTLAFRLANGPMQINRQPTNVIGNIQAAGLTNILPQTNLGQNTNSLTLNSGQLNPVSLNTIPAELLNQINSASTASGVVISGATLAQQGQMMNVRAGAGQLLGAGDNVHQQLIVNGGLRAGGGVKGMQEGGGMIMNQLVVGNPMHGDSVMTRPALLQQQLQQKQQLIARQQQQQMGIQRQQLLDVQQQQFINQQQLHLAQQQTGTVAGHMLPGSSILQQGVAQNRLPLLQQQLQMQQQQQLPLNNNTLQQQVAVGQNPQGLSQQLLRQVAVGQNQPGLQPQMQQHVAPQLVTLSQLNPNQLAQLQQLGSITNNVTFNTPPLGVNRTPGQTMSLNVISNGCDLSDNTVAMCGATNIVTSNVVNGNMVDTATHQLNTGTVNSMHATLNNTLSSGQQGLAKMKSGGAGTPGGNDPEKRRLIQQQLVLLLHAHKCQRREQMVGSGAAASPSGQACALPHCQTMKNVLKHMSECHAGKNCKVAHCASSRQIITHWKNCTRTDCPVCLPLKNASERRNSTASSSGSMPAVPASQPASIVNSQPNLLNPSLMHNSTQHADMARAYEALGLVPPPNPVSFSQTASSSSSDGLHSALYQQSTASSSLWMMSPDDSSSALGSGGANGESMGLDRLVASNVNNIPNRPVKAWHQSVTQDLRNHLVHKLVQAIFPTPDRSALKDKRINNLVQYARKVEGDMYETANSREEYYHLLAEKIYKIQKDLEEKRQARLQSISSTGNLTQQQRLLLSGLDQPQLHSNNQNGDGNLLNSQYSGAGGVLQSQLEQNGSQYDSTISSLLAGYNFGAGEDGLSGLSCQGLFGDSLNGPIDSLHQEKSQAGVMGSSTSSGASAAKQQLMDALAKQKLQMDKQQFLQQQQQQFNSPSQQQSQQRMQQQQQQTSASLIQQQLQRLTSFCASPTQQQDKQQLSAGGQAHISNPQSVPAHLHSIPQTPQSVPTYPQSVPPLGSNPPSVPSLRPDSAVGPDDSGLACEGGLTQTSQDSRGLAGRASLDNSSFDTMDTTMEDEQSNISGDSSESKLNPLGLLAPRGKVKVKPAELASDDTKDMDKIKIKVEPKVEGVDVKVEGLADVKMEVIEPTESKSKTDTSNCSALVKQEVKTKISANRKVWKPNELRQVLMPTLEKLYRLDPESLPFRQPVDPILQNIPDYFEYIKKPMDLSTIKRKLDTGEYTEPWQYIDDVTLMFENAWLYNRKSSKVHRFCTKLSEVFEVEIDAVMKSLGFCCGKKHVFSPMILICYGKYLCTVQVNATYYSYQNRYSYCEKCFNEIQGDEVELRDEFNQPPMKLKKELFMKTKNTEFEPEPLIECTQCGRKNHQICSMHFDPIWPGEFVCAGCMAANNTKRKEHKFTARRLPQTKLGSYLENRVNSFLKKKDAGAGDVTIRVLGSSEKSVEVKQLMKSRFCDNKEMAESFPYIAKAIFAFEEIEGVDVCFFGMHVQEYGSNAAAPNTRRVYLAYMDSVNFFQPRQYRTCVYHELLIGYLDYVKKLGYATVHIWACPPCEGDDYIFNCHPPDMKIPKPKRLQDWYKKMLDKAASEDIVTDYKDILKDAQDNNIHCVTEIPYFDGDYWPNIIEESIKEQDKEEDKRRKEEVEAAIAGEGPESVPETEDVNSEMPAGKKKGQKNAGSRKKNTKSKSSSQRKAGKSSGGSGSDLTTKLLNTMEKLKEGFFVVSLYSQASVASLPPIVDPDSFIMNDLMDGRDSFLAMAREKHYEFSSLRRAKYSSMAMLYELHTIGKDSFVYTCNKCKNNTDTYYHCETCDDYDLCVPCYESDGHEHKMEKLGGLVFVPSGGPSGTSGGDDGTVDGKPGGGQPGELNPAEARRQSIQRCITSLVHACRCRDANCRMSTCKKMKRVMAHTKECRKKSNPSNAAVGAAGSNNNCPICKQLIALCCFHAKHCTESGKCYVPFCVGIKQRLRQQQMQQRHLQSQMMYRRMAFMQSNRGSDSSASSSLGSSQPAPPVVVAPTSASPSFSARPLLTPTTAEKPPLSALLAARQIEESAQKQAQEAATSSLASELAARNALMASVSAQQQQQQQQQLLLQQRQAPQARIGMQQTLLMGQQQPQAQQPLLAGPQQSMLLAQEQQQQLQQQQQSLLIGQQHQQQSLTLNQQQPQQSMLINQQTQQMLVGQQQIQQQQLILGPQQQPSLLLGQQQLLLSQQQQLVANQQPPQQQLLTNQSQQQPMVVGQQQLLGSLTQQQLQGAVGAVNSIGQVNTLDGLSVLNTAGSILGKANEPLVSSAADGDSGGGVTSAGGGRMVNQEFFKFYESLRSSTGNDVSKVIEMIRASPDLLNLYIKQKRLAQVNSMTSVATINLASSSLTTDGSNNQLMQSTFAAGGSNTLLQQPLLRQQLPGQQPNQQLQQTLAQQLTQQQLQQRLRLPANVTPQMLQQLRQQQPQLQQQQQQLLQQQQGIQRLRGSGVVLNDPLRAQANISTQVANTTLLQQQMLQQRGVGPAQARQMFVMRNTAGPDLRHLQPLGNTAEVPWSSSTAVNIAPGLVRHAANLQQSSYPSLTSNTMTGLNAAGQIRPAGISSNQLSLSSMDVVSGVDGNNSQNSLFYQQQLNSNSLTLSATSGDVVMTPQDQLSSFADSL